MSGGRGFLNNQNNNQGHYNGRYNNNNNGRGRGFRRVNKYNNNNNNRNNVPDEAAPPLTYDAKPDKQNRIKIEWTHGRGVNARTESEKVAEYDDTAKEDYLRTLAQFKEILLDYPYLQSNNEAPTACRIFKRCLKGSAKESYSRAVAGVNRGTINTNLQLEEVVEEITNRILGRNAYDNQIEYLRTTKKPRKLTVNEWIQRIQNINLHLVNMERDATLLTDREIIKDIIMPNLILTAKYHLKILGGSALPWDRVNELLSNTLALSNV